MDKRIETTMKNLKRNNMKPFFVETKEEVVPLIKTLLSKGETVANGGSVSLTQCGVFEEILESGDYNFIDRRGLEGDAIREAYGKAYMSDSYFCSSNAVTEKGELFNVDGNSNRVSCIVYGPKQVIMVVGKNKIVKDIDEAIVRLKTVGAPPNCVRLNCDTPCAKTGKCVGLDIENYDMTDGCRGAGRICCNYVVSAQQRHKDRIKIIIVNEDLGY